MSVRKLAMILARSCWQFAVVLVLGMIFAGWTPPPWLLFVPALLPLVLLLILGRRTAAVMARAARAPVETEAPVSGRWTALNSPATKVPSHGIHGYGQTYAIDILVVPEPDTRPPFAKLWPIARRNSDYPAFGAPVLAVADATVVHVLDRRRDHLTRTSFPALAWMMLVEASLREAAGASWIVGNHVILDLGDGTYAVYAHLKRGSATVAVGDTVRAGQRIAECGNTGNSTEAHVHFQLMDGPDLDTARGIPFTWRGVGVPANGEAFTPQDTLAPQERLTAKETLIPKDTLTPQEQASAVASPAERLD